MRRDLLGLYIVGKVVSILWNNMSVFTPYYAFKVCTGSLVLSIPASIVVLILIRHPPRSILTKMTLSALTETNNISMPPTSLRDTLDISQISETRYPPKKTISAVMIFATGHRLTLRVVHKIHAHEAHSSRIKLSGREFPRLDTNSKDDSVSVTCWVRFLTLLRSTLFELGKFRRNLPIYFTQNRSTDATPRTVLKIRLVQLITIRQPIK
jgi:hypothetical protein